MNAIDAKDRYLADTVATASPARLLTMLYERLVRDLRLAMDELRDGTPEGAGRHLVHAQEIVLELRASLKPELWSGGPALAELYSYMITQLIMANVQKDATIVATIVPLVESLGDAWREAATASAASPARPAFAAAV
jgi:flagellar secretion chaperone FliS